MPRAKKAASAKAAKINKSAWIRSKPTSLSAAEVVEKAKAEGIKITPTFVYTVRTAAKAKTKKAASAKGSRRSEPTGAHLGDELALKRIILAIGFTRTAALIADLRKTVGL